ncbi:uncharacterized protein LOC107040283 [Diachasma alloeum]|uniref:uncharacterized protein LOC107040283 n=1 Tax=Diachasma alloeum TaxID=454923 RepID=UPI0007383294|nr:uncharacterized protein LOC107040283 [Diachasma alloeum]
MQISNSDYYHRGTRSSMDRRTNQLAGVSSTVTSVTGTNTTNCTKDNSTFRISTTVKASELWCCCCNCANARNAKAPGFLACLGVCVLVFGYTLLGAFAFMALEGGFKTDQPTDLVRLASSTTSKSSKSSLNTAGDETNGAIVQIPDDEDSSARELRAYTVERLWSITEDLNVLYKENWTRLAEREIMDFQEKMTRTISRDKSKYSVTVQRSPRGNDRRNLIVDRRWTFGSSLLYSLTLITTIGYGSVAPRTVWGRVITIVYALAGIPLMLVYLSTVGDVFARTFRAFYGRMCHRSDCRKRRKGKFLVSSPSMPGIIEKSYHRYENHIETGKLTPGFYSKEASCDELGVRAGAAILLDREGIEGNIYLHPGGSNTGLQEGNMEKRHLHPSSQMSLMPSTMGYGTDTICVVRIPISLCLLIIVVYVCAGAFVFNRLEGWSLLESSYFCFTSLGTIGFGDLVPMGRNASTRLLEEMSLCACSVYILFGMGLIAMCFNLMQEEVVRVVRVFGRTCGSTGITANSIGANGLKSDLCEDGSITGITDNCHEHEDDGIAMSMVSAS